MISAVIGFSDNRISIHSSDTAYVGKTFPKGFYESYRDNEGLHITQKELGELHLPYKTEENSNVINTVESFFKEGIREKVKTLGFIHKLGCLIHGTQGTGKTSVMHFIAKKLIEERDAIVFFCNTSNTLTTAMYLSGMIREIQDNPIIFIADEFERYAREAESEMKNFLDGNTSIDNMLFLGATNYIDKVPDTLKNRPSRFKVVQELKGITDKKLMASVIRDISSRIQPGLFTEQEIKDKVEELSTATLDEIKHLCLDKIAAVYLPKPVLRNTIGFKREPEVASEEQHPKAIAYFSYSSSKSEQAPIFDSTGMDSNI